MPQCFDINNVPQDCNSASDSGGSSCFDDTAQEVSCSEVGGYANALGTTMVPGITSGPQAENASKTGAAATLNNAAGPSFFHTLATLIPAGAAAYVASQQPPPRTTSRANAAGLSVPGGNAGTLLLVAALVVGGGFLYFAGKKK